MGLPFFRAASLAIKGILRPLAVCDFAKAYFEAFSFLLVFSRECKALGEVRDSGLLAIHESCNFQRSIPMFENTGVFGNHSKEFFGGDFLYCRVVIPFSLDCKRRIKKSTYIYKNGREVGPVSFWNFWRARRSFSAASFSGSIFIFLDRSHPLRVWRLRHLVKRA
jgi:hypothetical protein